MRAAATACALLRERVPTKLQVSHPPSLAAGSRTCPISPLTPPGRATPTAGWRGPISNKATRLEGPDLGHGEPAPAPRRDDASPAAPYIPLPSGLVTRGQQRQGYSIASLAYTTRPGPRLRDPGGRRRAPLSVRGRPLQSDPGDRMRHRPANPGCGGQRGTDRVRRARTSLADVARANLSRWPNARSGPPPVSRISAHPLRASTWWSPPPRFTGSTRRSPTPKPPCCSARADG